MLNCTKRKELRSELESLELKAKLHINKIRLASSNDNCNLGSIKAHRNALYRVENSIAEVNLQLTELDMVNNKVKVAASLTIATSLIFIAACYIYDISSLLPLPTF